MADSDRSGLDSAYLIASVAGTALGAYHGYRRDGSVGWALLWGLFGGALPVFAIPVMVAQGVGKKA